MTSLREVISCGACVVDLRQDGPYVLLVRPNDYADIWGIPKGHLNPGEDELKCAVREVVEETGVFPFLFPFYRLGEVVARHGDERKTVKSFLALPLSNLHELARDEENFDVRYFHVEMMPSCHRYQVPLFKEIYDRLHDERVLKRLTQTQDTIRHLRAHDNF